MIQVVREHLAEFPAFGEELIFRGPLGAPLRRNNFHRSVDWSNLVVKAGLRLGSTYTIFAIPGTTWRRPAVRARVS